MPNNSKLRICQCAKLFLNLGLILKSLKVFRLKASILGLKFVNLVMFNCSLLSKTCLNVYRHVQNRISEKTDFSYKEGKRTIWERANINKERKR